MTHSPASSLSQPEALALHRRLLDGDPTASADLAAALLEPLIGWLANVAAKVPEDVRVQAAEDALLNLIRSPEKYDPKRQTLEVYLRLSARGDLRNALEKERRQRKREVPLDRVELSPQAGKYLGTMDDPSLRLLVAEELERGADGIPEAVRARLSPVDLEALELLRRKVRGHEPYAALFGLLDLPVEEQRRVVNRHKERLRKAVQRAGGKL